MSTVLTAVHKLRVLERKKQNLVGYVREQPSTRNKIRTIIVLRNNVHHLYVPFTSIHFLCISFSSVSNK